MNDNERVEPPQTVQEIKALEAGIDWSELKIPKATVGGAILPPQPEPPKRAGWWSKLTRRR